jgi:hypothetical protein
MELKVITFEALVEDSPKSINSSIASKYRWGWILFELINGFVFRDQSLNTEVESQPKGEKQK